MKNKPANPLECIILIIVLIKLYQLCDYITNKLFNMDFGGIIIYAIIIISIIFLFLGPFLPWDKWRENDKKHNIYDKNGED